jgi:hypothetical protein
VSHFGAGRATPCPYTAGSGGKERMGPFCVIP